MTTRVLIGQHVGSGEIGLWVANPGYDCNNDDRTDRSKFRISTSFPGRRPFRLVGAGYAYSNNAINLPSSVAGLGGEPLLSYRVMNNNGSERGNAGFGEGRGPNYTYGGSEFQTRFSDGNPANFKVLYMQNQASTAYLIRYMLFIF